MPSDTRQRSHAPAPAPSTVGLVDGDDVGQLQHAFLEPLQLVARARLHEDEEEVDESATAVSDWPTPTVSTMTTSKPAASHSSIVSRVSRGDAAERAGAGGGADEGVRLGCEAASSASCRRGSSRRCAGDEGSTASTATRWPRPVSIEPSASISVDLPTPGAPVIPDPWAPPVLGRMRLDEIAGGRLVVRPARLDQA